MHRRVEFESWRVAPFRLRQLVGVLGYQVSGCLTVACADTSIFDLAPNRLGLRNGVNRLGLRNGVNRLGLNDWATRPFDPGSW
jgi:hypothetical protein